MNREQAIECLKDKTGWNIWKAIRGRSESNCPNLLTNNETSVMQFVYKTLGFGMARLYLQLIAGDEGQHKLNKLLGTNEN